MVDPVRLFSPKVWACALAALLLGFAAQPAKAGFTFKNITNNNATDAAAGEAQLSVGVTAVGTTRVAFTFKNVGSAAMSITDVYFDDGTLLGISSVTNGPGVSFTGGSASPGNLPGGNGNPINFDTTAGFLADSDSPRTENGVNPGETLTITFNLINGKTYANTIAAINLSLANPGVDMTDGLRIGIHVQAFSSGGSESFVNGRYDGNPTTGGDPAVITPAPGGLVLLATALPFAFGLRRRLSRREVAA